ncbi:MAG: trypsin-like peptidase domain-containing protein [Clostridia bacterium]|nr:trypsin-like peptidase domain-containing protein [Clostridia bacterium]
MIKKCRKAAAVFLMATIFTGSVVCAAPTVEVNGVHIDTDAVIIDDRTYVPLRGVFEAAGASVSWNNETATASVAFPRTAEDDIIPSIIEAVSPTVVGIIGRGEVSSYFGTQEGLMSGSGIIIKSGGEILTNAHVVKDMNTILVVMNDGKGYEAQLKYIDEETDLAVVKIKKIGLPVAAFANTEDITVGKRVIAIGTPITFSLRNSATVGYISGINRSVGEPYRLIQTDTAITHGNSGGALVNMKGEVVGITSNGYEGTGTNFAIPVDTVKYVLNQFEVNGRVRRPYFGAEFREDWLAELGVPSEAGLTIKSLEKTSPLAGAGFKTGDVLVSAAGTAVNSIVELNELMKGYNPGDSVRVGVKTGGEIIYADVVLGEKPEKKSE